MPLGQYSIIIGFAMSDLLCLRLLCVDLHCVVSLYFALFCFALFCFALLSFGLLCDAKAKPRKAMKICGARGETVTCDISWGLDEERRTCHM